MVPNILQYIVVSCNFSWLKTSFSI